jgi:anti-sigma regulatory factor (Ser/Thr protein kinase)
LIQFVPGNSSAVDTRTTLGADAGSAAAARRFVADVLNQRGFSKSAIEDAVLLASEVVTNAVLHAGGSVDVVVIADSSMARVEVHDDHPSHPVLLTSGPEATFGRGLRVIEALAGGWGVDDRGDRGKCVWFEVRS